MHLYLWFRNRLTGVRCYAKTAGYCCCSTRHTRAPRNLKPGAVHGSASDTVDNAVAESFFATPECELLDRHP
jgi:hypothetical protein